MKRWTERSLTVLTLWLVVSCSHAWCDSPASFSGHSGSWQRVTAHLYGVFAPRGYFNILVGLYSLPTLKCAQFNMKSSTIIMDFSPGSPPITPEQIHHIEKLAGYRPGPVSSEWIAAQNLHETGPGWIKIKHPRSRNTLVRWLQQNF